MNNVIMVRVNGIMPGNIQREYREQLLNDIKEGLFIVDEGVKDVIVTSMGELGIKED